MPSVKWTFFKLGYLLFTFEEDQGRKRLDSVLFYYSEMNYL